MRRAAKIDTNHPAIVAALRDIGCSVQSLAVVGKGCPDLLVGWRHRNLLLEVKDGNRAPSERRLTPDEDKWIDGWRGQVTVVLSVQDALEQVEALTR